MLLVQPLSQPMRSGYQLFINLTYAVVLRGGMPQGDSVISWPGSALRSHLGGILGKDARHRRQVADVAIGHAEERDDGGLVGCNAVEIAH
jgi:hypothetical protein